MDHLHDHHEHSHGHHHDHGHSHDHGHDHGASDYYLEQLLTITICGGFGLVGVLMYQFGMLNELLAPEFHRWVAIGGGVLLFLTAIRAISMWATAGTAAGHHHHDHDHEPAADAEHVHGPDCDHTHDHDHEHTPVHAHTHAHAHAHAHDDHDHGNIFWRIVVLAFPLVLFFLGLPNEAFMRNYKERKLGKDVEIGAIGDVQATGKNVPMDFNQLASATLDPGKRMALEGSETSIVGQFKPIGEKEFTLFRMKMTCCAADMIPLKARIVPDFVPYNVKPYDWVRVTGILQFVEVPGKSEYLPVLRVKNASGIQTTKAEL